MSSTIQTTLQLIATTVETLDPNTNPGIATGSLTHSQLNTKLVLDGGSAPPVSFLSERKISASASGTIDLTSLPTTQGTLSATGLKLVVLRINNRGGHTFTLATGASNGYTLPNSINVDAGGMVEIVFTARIAIDGTHKNLDYTFNAADQADITLILG